MSIPFEVEKELDLGIFGKVPCFIVGRWFPGHPSTFDDPGDPDEIDVTKLYVTGQKGEIHDLTILLSNLTQEGSDKIDELVIADCLEKVQKAWDDYQMEE